MSAAPQPTDSAAGLDRARPRRNGLRPTGREILGGRRGPQGACGSWCGPLGGPGSSHGLGPRSLTRQRWRRGLLCAALLGLPGAARSAPPVEPYVVLQRGVELYDGPHRLPARLWPGDVLPACPDDLHRDWLTVFIDRTPYQARAKGLCRLSDLEVSYAARLADLAGRSEALTRQIRALDERIAQLYAAERAIRFDATLRYRYREPVIPPPGPPVRGAPGITPWLPPPVQYVEHYEDKVPVPRARQLAQRWARERADLERQAETLREQRRERLRERVATEAQRASAARRFAAFRPGGISPASEPYVCVRNRTQLFAGTTLAQELDADMVVVATPNRDDDDWLKVQWNGHILDTRRDGFLNRLDLETQMGQRAAWLEQAIRDAVDEADAWTARRQLLEAVGLAADYAAALEFVALRAYPFPPDYRGQGYYTLPRCPLGAVELVDRARAQRYVRDCDQELDDVEEHVGDLEKRLRSWRRELAALGPRLEDLRRRLDAAR